MKQISKYYYADTGMRFAPTKAGLNNAECRKAFTDYPCTMVKVPISWVETFLVKEIIDDGRR